MPSSKLNQACTDAIAEIEKKVAEFRSRLDSGTSDPEKFMTLSEIENLWAQLNRSTTKTYSDMISAYLSDLDEKAVIKLKKENIKETESG